MENKKYVLGLDLGVASIGWGMVELDEDNIPIQILDHGAVIFKSLDNDKGELYNQVRRSARGSRRVIRRRKERLRLIKNLIKKEMNIQQKDIDLLFHGNGIIQNNDAINLKIKGVEEKLSTEEIIRVLIHYAKNRGFKSNRKIDSKEEKGKMKEAIGKVQEIMRRDQCTVSKAVKTLQDEKGYQTIHNTKEQYIYGFERSDVEGEIKILLNKQKEFGLISDDFIASYLSLWGNQRDFSEGPAEGPYQVSFEKLFGFCKFRTGEKRISRACPSFEKHVALKKLQDLRYFELDDNGAKVYEGNRIKKHQLTKEQIQKVYHDLFSKDKVKSITYAYLTKLINEDVDFNAIIQDIPSIPKKKFKEKLQKYKKENKIDVSMTLSDKQYQEFKEEVRKETMKQEFISATSYKSLQSSIKKITKEIHYLDGILLDKIATILSYAQTDSAIEKTIKENYKNDFDKEAIELIKQLKTSVSGTGSLSLSLVQDLNELMLNEGLSYEKAMDELGYNHSIREKNSEFSSIFPTIKEIEEVYETVITQPNVKHVLVYLRKLYLALCEKYGKPEFVHIEIARDIRNDFENRRQIRNSQISNQVENANAKLKMAEVLGLEKIEGRNYKNFSREDTIKFRLWNDQNEMCMYTGEKIKAEDLLDRNAYQVDHILPFSRTFDDSYENKILVKSSANQEKGNKTPYEWMGKSTDWNNYKDRVLSCKTISDTKRDKLLHVGDIDYNEFTAQSLHATSYVSKLTVQIFKDVLNDSDNKDRVRSFKGGATSYLRKYYKLNGLTHSLESKTYNRNDTEYQILKENIKISHDKKSASIVVIANDKYGRDIEYSIKVGKKKESDEFGTVREKEIYEVLSQRKEEVIKFLEKHICNQNIREIDDFELLKYVGGKDSQISRIVYDLLTGLKAIQNQKNRDNHFHHVVDALLVATMTRSMQMKITKFDKLLQQVKRNEKQIIDEETGEIHDKSSLLREFNIDETNKNHKYYIPQPYKNFIEELKVKVFERDADVLKLKLKEIGKESNNVEIKYPSFQVDKRVSGALHAEYIYGVRQENNQEVGVIRKNITEIKEKDIEKIFDKDGSQKQVYEAVKEWSKLTTAQKKEKPYPRLKNGNEVKKVKLANIIDREKLMQLSPTNKQKGYAGISEVARIAIYKKSNSEKLFFVQIAIDQYLKLKKGNTNFNITVWWGQGKNKEYINYQNLEKQGYKLYTQLYPGQHIEIFMNNGNSTIARVIGFTSGQFELESILGDQIDFISDSVIEKNMRWKPTVSTIRDIQWRNIDILGNLK